MALLNVKAVSKVFGQLRALDGVDLVVQAGTFHGLIGPNGSGKSTLLKAIAGAYLPTAGSIAFDGRDITEALPYERSRAGLSSSTARSSSPTDRAATRTRAMYRISTRPAWCAASSCWSSM